MKGEMAEGLVGTAESQGQSGQGSRTALGLHGGLPLHWHGPSLCGSPRLHPSGKPPPPAPEDLRSAP